MRLSPRTTRYRNKLTTSLEKNPGNVSATVNVKNYEWDEEKEELTVFDEFDPKRLFTVDEMMSDGFEREESRISIRAVKAAIRKAKARKKKSSSKKA